MTGVRAIVFDCDGVLIESKQANLAYYNAVLAQFGAAPVSPEDVQMATLCHTASSPQVLEVLLGREHSEEALRYAQTLDYREFIPFLTLEPGLPEVLKALSENYPLALATNRGTSATELLEYFSIRQYFSSVVTSRDVPRPKPWPDMLHEAARRLNCESREMMFIGDSELDFEAAQGAGVRFIAYKNELGDATRVHSHMELLSLVCDDPGNRLISES